MPIIKNLFLKNLVFLNSSLLNRIPPVSIFLTFAKDINHPQVMKSPDVELY
jgi:hypothetical protein